MWYTYIYLPHRSLTQVPAQVAPAEDWPGPSADVDDLQLVEGGEQVDDSCSSAGEFSPGSRQEQWGNNYLINKLIAIGDD